MSGKRSGAFKAELDDLRRPGLTLADVADRAVMAGAHQCPRCRHGLVQYRDDDGACDYCGTTFQRGR